MSNNVMDGLILIVIGMLVVFAGLIILMVAIMVLNRLLPDREREKDEPAPEAILREESEREKVAVLAVALAMAMNESEAVSKEQGNRQVEVVLVGDGRWAAAGRQRTMYSRQKAGRQWAGRSN